MDSYIITLDTLDTEILLPNILMAIIAILAVLAILLIWIIVLSVKLARTKKRLKKFLPKDKNIDIENMLIKYNENVLEFLQKEDNILKTLDENQKNLNDKIENTNKLIYLTNEKLKNAVQKVSIIRYNPFDEVGGDLCYAIALLDENNNGVVINSIYSREACYSYAKEIVNGKCESHKLSSEEQQVLNEAINK